MSASYSVRLKIPYFSYSLNPSRAIHQLLGNNITLLSYQANDIISPDNEVIVDVTYNSLPLSMLKIYYIPISSLKQIIPNSDKYAITINECNVKITIPKIKDFPKVIPIRVRAMLSNNYSASGQLDSQFLYYGTTVTNPMNNLCSPLKYIGHEFEPFETETIEPIYPPSFKTQIQNSDKSKFDSLLQDTITHYKRILSTFSILSSIDYVVSVKTFQECKLGTTGYVIPFEIIPTDKTLNGIILIQSKRIPNYVLFYPSYNFKICPEELQSIKDFLTQDETNYYNFRYAKEVMNK